jgi:ABC-type phosphate transport system ATPase subunit
VQHFIGREQELEQLCQDVQPGRVVTLCGPGGIGKSALVSEAVHRLMPEGRPPKNFPDGIIFHSFYGRPEVNLALEHIALSFGQEPKPSPAIAAQQVLAGKRVLLILDGTEASENWQEVLKVRGTCGALVTSRKRRDAKTTDRLDIHPL